MGAGITWEREKSKIPHIKSILPLEKRLTPSSKTKPKKILLIAGPTACGKTTLSLMLAEKLKGEIISADSMQVYRGMDIGTAKVSLEDQTRIPHYLIDIRSVQEPFNVVDYYYEAKQACDSILARGHVPLFVGGSGFYFRSILYGPPQGPPSMPDLRHRLEQEMEQFGADKCYLHLKEIDPVYAASITPRDRHKIVRALEIITLTGEKVSNLEWKHDQLLPDYEYHCWFLHRPREILYQRINDRCDEMLEAGLIDEVKALEKQGLRSNPSASQAIGYRQVLDYLQTPQTPQDYEQFVHLFKTASRHYAKRQFTWFRKESHFHWLDVELHDMEIAMEIIINEFQRE